MAKIIAVTGKGGTGKTTVTSLILRHLKQHAVGPILALDADPDSNLSTVLGLTVEKTIGDLREETLRSINDLPAGIAKGQYIEAGLHEIVVESEKVDLIAMGRSEGPRCYCYINNLLRTFSDHLQASYEWVVVDNEAGLEHLSRRTASRIDHLFVVITDNPLAVDCAKRIEQLTNDKDYPVVNKYLLANNIVDENRVRKRVAASGLNMELVGCVPRDPELEAKLMAGESVFSLAGSPAVLAIEEVMKVIQAKQ
ncbi:MAG: hypothetical protein E4H02_00965 [Lentisphaerales bacterium]|jgi:CO dehydrogenase maturation factor|nr:MAG: hypothetical protein E4H02_00965 [Lentisphaerales bacterium]